MKGDMGNVDGTMPEIISYDAPSPGAERDRRGRQFCCRRVSITGIPNSRARSWSAAPSVAIRCGVERPRVE